VLHKLKFICLFWESLAFYVKFATYKFLLYLLYACALGTAIVACFFFVPVECISGVENNHSWEHTGLVEPSWSLSPFIRFTKGQAKDKLLKIKCFLVNTSHERTNVENLLCFSPLNRGLYRILFRMNNELLLTWIWAVSLRNLPLSSNQIWWDIFMLSQIIIGKRRKSSSTHPKYYFEWNVDINSQPG
jgi:hypothetical protein